MVAVPLNLRYKLEEQLGKQIMFMGDVLPDMVDGHYAMKMNPAYGGGVIMDTEQIAAARHRIIEGKESWYEIETKRLGPVFDDIVKKGVNLSDWRAVWESLQVIARSRLGT